MKSKTLCVRITSDLKMSVESTLHPLSITTSESINIFYHQILLHDDLLSPIKNLLYNSTTLTTLKESNNIYNGNIPAKTCKNATG